MNFLGLKLFEILFGGIYRFVRLAKRASGTWGFPSLPPMANEKADEPVIR